MRVNDNQPCGHDDLDPLHHRIRLLVLVVEGAHQQRVLAARLHRTRHIDSVARQLEDERQAGGIEGHEDDVVDDHRHDGEAAQRLEPVHSAERAHADHERCHERVQRDGRTQDLHAAGDAGRHLGLVVGTQRQLGQGARLRQVD